MRTRDAHPPGRAGGRLAAPRPGAAVAGGAGPRARTAAEVQAGLLAMAERWSEDLRLLRGMRRGLRPPPDLEARQEQLKPPDVTTELIGGLECLTNEAVPGLIKTLRGLAAMTDRRLLREFNRWQAER